MVMGAHAEYAPKVESGLYPKKEVAKGVRALRNLPTMIRQAVLTDKLGLLYLPDGEYAHETTERKSRNGEEFFFDVKAGARFIGSDGKEYDFSLSGYQAAAKNGFDMVAKNGKPTLFGNWVISREVISTTDGDPVFISFANDITKLVRQLAKYRLKSMPAKLRMLCLADCANLLVLPGAHSAYTGELVKSPRDGSRRQLEWPQRAAGAVFYDAAGEEQSVDQIYAQCCSKASEKRALEDVQWCAQLIGREDILSLYDKEVKALQKAHAAAAEKQPAAELAARGGEARAVAYEPAPPIRGYYPAVEHMKKLPQRAREALLAKLFCLAHVSSGELVESRNNLQPHEKAFYIGSDGREYLYGAELNSVLTSYPQETEEILNEGGACVMYYTFAAEIQAMAAHLVQRLISEMPEELRDAWIASVDGLVYKPDKRVATPATSVSGGTERLYTKTKEYSADALYTDAAGKEHVLAEVVRAYPEFARHYRLLNSVIALLGRDVLLSSLAEQVTPLREQFSKVCHAPTRGENTLATTLDNHPVIQALYTLPMSVRQAYLASQFWLVYGKDVLLPRRIKERESLCFLGTDGREYSLSAEFDKLPAELKETDEVYGDHYLLFSAFAAEVSDMVRRMAIKRLMELSAENREAVLADLSGLLYEANGNRVRTRYQQCGSGFAGTTMEPRGSFLQANLVFVSLAGKKFFCKDMPVFNHAQMNAPESLARVRAQILFFSDIVGNRFIMADFPKAVQDLRWARDEARKTNSAPLGEPSGGAATESAQEDEEETTAMGSRFFR